MKRQKRSFSEEFKREAVPRATLFPYTLRKQADTSDSSETVRGYPYNG